MNIQLTYHRRQTTTTQVGGLSIGSEFPVRIQTMANTSTNDIAGSVAQAERCIAAGTELLRFTTQGIREVESLSQIRHLLQAEQSTGEAELQGSARSTAKRTTIYNSPCERSIVPPLLFGSYSNFVQEKCQCARINSPINISCLFALTV